MANSVALTSKKTFVKSVCVMFVWLAASAILVSCMPKHFTCTRDGSAGRTLTRRKATYAADRQSNSAQDPSIYTGYTGTVDTPRSSDDPTFTLYTLAFSGLAAIVLATAISTTLAMLQRVDGDAHPVARSSPSAMTTMTMRSAAFFDRGTESAVPVYAAPAYFSPTPEPLYLAPDAPAAPGVAPAGAAPIVTNAPIFTAVAGEDTQVSAVVQLPAVAMVADAETSETRITSSAGANADWVFGEGSAFKALRKIGQA